MSQTEDYTPGDSVSDSSRETWFSEQFYTLSEKRTSNMTRVHPFVVSEKTDQHIHSESVKPWHLGKETYHQRSTSTGVPGKEAFTIYL